MWEAVIVGDSVVVMAYALWEILR
ncbi:hypothetical protein RB2654_05004 [Rhodobacterales bacterium HTCC2654]|uniref:Uncharacterized protein n=1 Tax=Maritimibacter alkaliphilus HTCC2654 TaxID=314271 RepID=A3VLE9_9RHOB|nr:hypothetical protein RB2654_05004 [Rhodobacterales bacterium HTCC2654] [Maritimibacter alkaliphilus HTCC2654]